MVRLQPDIIVARISSNIGSIISASSISETTESQSSVSPPRSQNKSILSNKQAGTGNAQDLVNRQFRTWTSSPSWVSYLVGSLEYWHRYETQKGSQKRVVDAKYRSPTWISDTTWYARGFNESYSGWKFYLQTYRLLPRNHRVFEYVEEGNIAGLQEMLSIGQAYVTDREVYGEKTLLHVSFIDREGFRRLTIFPFIGCNGSRPIGNLQAATQRWS